MSDAPLKTYGPLVRFLEKQAEWLGLGKNAGPVLAVLYLAKYQGEGTLSAEDIADRTSYSRSNVGLIISQMEALGLISGEMDYDQTGRGRRRFLYFIEDKVSSIVSLGIKKTIDKLEDSITEMESIKNLYRSDAPHVAKMMDGFLKEAREIMLALKPLPESIE
ncbi:MAG: hypothetical protein EAX95_15890 [Candidatus Thorarchaeota archaeon]|nr:hypothetical protein [Candidatus Thorarchaeota archaeon]